MCAGCWATVRYREATGIGGGDPVYAYTHSLSHDSEISCYVPRVIKAHVKHLAEKGIIDEDTARRVLEALDRLECRPPGEGGYEDIFEYIEDKLEEATGGASKSIWIGRSRNDHVSAALRLYAKDKLEAILEALSRLEEAINGFKSRHGGVIIPFHTHRQPSQIATVDCLAGAWLEAVRSARIIIEAALGLVDRSPLGSSAGAGTVAPIDRERLAELAGFSGVVENPLYATGSRMDMAAAVYAAALVLAEESRIAGDIIHYSSPYIGIMRVPDSHVATSSIMPHKRNPATLEVLIARASRAQACAHAYTSIYTGLMNGYSLDLQEGNPCMYTVLSDTLEATGILADLVEGLSVDPERAEEVARRFVTWSAEEAEMLALEEGIPLRDAYTMVAGRIGELAGRDPRRYLRARSTGCKLPGYEGTG